MRMGSPVTKNPMIIVTFKNLRVLAPNGTHPRKRALSNHPATPDSAVEGYAPPGRFTSPVALHSFTN